ncbi:hypothetical protein [Bacillus toyonensis]|uniref:hypothetical protein n=1 Tax=Bacillus toyonensis TaxID=155322 RepID=UPI000BEFD4BF|nr:hypothetical protein [Bacillus toyonensis]KAB2380229.1 hypothetical protein F8507_27490 [Bacillus toyonensis]PEL23441.1 hypothetical protein CN624_21310 [Bacillus toyonensis]PEM64431.1 hypothetical protein CN625_01590 [Bacillus toyonensis]PFY49077.1 hypothetical protein COL55_13295 [Bacillus toyonensis]PFY86022.1 hypothetical protein COL62_02170 [Bacillus toyonensis]
MSDKKNNSGKKVKSVAFQLDDPMEFKLYYHSLNQGVYFSTYIKRLIQRDVEGGWGKSLTVEELKKWRNSEEE